MSAQVEYIVREILLDIKGVLTMTANEQAVADALSTYNQALNASDTNAVMPLYAEGGVFMPPYSSSAVGLAAVRRAYDVVFAAIKLTVKFTIVEIVEMSPEWVFARTNSAGSTLNHATGEVSREGNQELFIFQKEKDGKFKIARYSFSTTNPQKG
jgi:ketosteroid isomerase-like protein